MPDSSAAGEQAARIAMVTGQLAHGGAERQLTLLARELQKHCEFVPVVFCLSGAIDPYGSVLTAAGVEWYSPPASSRSRLRRLLWLVRKLAESRYSLVYGVLNTGNIYGGAAALASGLPFVGSIRNADSSLPLTMRTLSGLFCRRARAVIANSPSCVVSLRTNLGVQHKRVYVIPNAVVLPDAAPDARHRLRQEWSVPENAHLVGTVANLKPQKRAHFFLHAAAALYQNGASSLYYVWAGEGPERARLGEYLTQIPHSLADKIHFPGARLDVSDCLAAFDAFVLTSSYEGLPSALLEAMAVGLPCVATNVPGTRDIFEGSLDKEIGLLADANDPARFADTLLNLLRDTERMQRMGDNAQRHVHERYGLESMVSRFREVFRNVIDQDMKNGGTFS